MSDLKALLERADHAVSDLPLPDGGLDGLQRRRDRKRRNQRIAAGVVGIAVFVAAVWIVTAGGSFDRTQRPANEPSTVNQTDTAEDVVRGFLAAFGAFDAEAAMTFVADDADLRWIIEPPLPANERGLSMELALLEAQRVQLSVTSCQAAPFGSGTSVVCGFDFHAIASDALGLGPFTGSTFVFTVRDGEIVKAASNPNLKQFKSQMRAPFAEWVAATYPRDFRVMYNTGSIPQNPKGFRQVRGRPTEESMRLWRLHIPEYVEAVQQGTA
jgi:hypothetical protein